MRFRRSKQIAPQDLAALERRIAHLEAMIEGLQDAVHREAVRSNDRFEEIEKQIEPGELSRRLSRDARERGL
jgi:hypothetical protein